jgi:hypothetical protein
MDTIVYFKKKRIFRIGRLEHMAKALIITALCRGVLKLAKVTTYFSYTMTSARALFLVGSRIYLFKYLPA